MAEEIAEVSEGTQEVPVSMIGDDGNFTENWMETAGIAEDLRGDQTLKNTKNVASLASQLINAQKMIGKSANMTIIPTDKSSQTEWEEFYKATGRPDTADEYQIAHVEGVGEIDAGVEGAFKNLAHSEGLRPSTVQKLIELDDNRMMAIKQAMERADLDKHDAALTALKEKWGGAFDDRLKLANRMIEDNTTDETKEALLDRVANDPIVGDFLANIAKKFVEHKIISADIDQPTPVEALSKIEELNATPGYIDGTLHKTSPATHERIKNEIAKLYKQAYPDKG